MIIASQHNANFNTIATDYNGNIDNTNIATNAAIAYSKLNLTGNIVNADINASAAIVASKLDLTSPGAIGSTSANTGAFSTLKVGTTHQGDILYDNGTSLVRLTPGTSGQFLQTQGASANPQWGSNGLVLVSSTSVSGVTTTGDITINGTSIYLVICHFTAVNTGDVFTLRFNNDTGSHYGYVVRGIDLGATASNSNAAAAAATGINMNVSGLASSNSPFDISFYIYPQQTTSVKGANIQGRSTGIVNASSTYGYWDFFGNWSNSADITSFRILDGALASFTGTIYVYKYSLS